MIHLNENSWTLFARVFLVTLSAVVGFNGVCHCYLVNRSPSSLSIFFFVNRFHERITFLMRWLIFRRLSNCLALLVNESNTVGAAIEVLCSAFLPIRSFWCPLLLCFDNELISLFLGVNGLGVFMSEDGKLMFKWEICCDSWIALENFVLPRFDWVVPLGAGCFWERLEADMDDCLLFMSAQFSECFSLILVDLIYLTLCIDFCEDLPFSISCVT